MTSVGWIASPGRTAALGLLFAVSLTVSCGPGGGSGITAAPTPTSAAATAVADGCARAAGLTGEVSDHGTAVATGATLTIEAGDFFFAPTCLTGVQAGAASVSVRNSGRILHNISVPAQGIDTDVEPGQSVTVQVKVESTAVRLLCKYHRTAGMTGALVPADGKR